MAIKDILLHLDNSPNCQTRIDLAIQIAKRHGAHIKGIYVLTHSYYAPNQTAAEAAGLDTVRTIFTTKVAAAGISAEWLYIDCQIVGVKMTEMIIRFTYYTDLVIIGQPGEASSSAGVPFDLPERLGLASGKPMLIVPYAGNFNHDMKRIMVAWKAGRESSRTLFDALPFLIKSEHLSIVTVASTARPEEGVEDDMQKLNSYLSRHQIESTHDQILTPSSFPVGDTLLNHACEQKMDLLVMGGFASSRRGAFMLGPVARHLMNHMTVPVLISH
jgi:nucleotide-binding universal stress UspA family protein